MDVKILKLNEVAQKLRVSKTTAYRMAQQGILPSVRFGGSVRVLAEDLEHFIEENRREAQVVE